jgi:hypothetical protein
VSLSINYSRESSAELFHFYVHSVELIVFVGIPMGYYLNPALFVKKYLKLGKKYEK